MKKIKYIINNYILDTDYHGFNNLGRELKTKDKDNTMFEQNEREFKQMLCDNDLYLDDNGNICFEYDDFVVGYLF